MVEKREGRKEEFARRKKRREGKKLTIKCNVNVKEFDVTTKNANNNNRLNGKTTTLCVYCTKQTKHWTSNT